MVLFYLQQSTYVCKRHCHRYFINMTMNQPTKWAKHLKVNSRQCKKEHSNAGDCPEGPDDFSEKVYIAMVY